MVRAREGQADRGVTSCFPRLNLAARAQIRGRTRGDGIGNIDNQRSRLNPGH